MRNIIWCISTGYEHMLPGPHAANGYYLDNIAKCLQPAGEDQAFEVMVWKGQTPGLSSAVMPPYAYIPKSVNKGDLIRTMPSSPTKF